MTNNQTKIRLFLDVDDVILKSSETIIQLLNKKYNITPPKTIADLKDWGYHSIYKNLTHEDVCSLYESDDFFNNVAVDEGFKQFCTLLADKFDIFVVTKGTPLNLSKKEDYLKREATIDFNYRGMTFDHDEYGVQWDYDKSCINMHKGIHIDDCVDALRSSNASIKILFRDRECYLNTPASYANIENLYVVRSWEEIITILDFIYNNYSIMV